MKHGRDELDRRVEIARTLLRERRVLVEPDPGFAAGVLARLSEPETWTFAWAARRVLPATLAVAAALTVAILAESGLPDRTVPAARVYDSQSAGDPLDWLLEIRGEAR